MKNVLSRNARKEGKCGQVWSRRVPGIMKGTEGTEEKERIHTKEMMIGIGVGGDTEAVKGFGDGVDQQDGPGIIMMVAQDIDRQYICLKKKEVN